MIDYYHYYILALIFLLFAFFEALADFRFLKPLLVFFCFLLLFLFAGFRGYDFSDYLNYVRIYNEAYDLQDLLFYGGYTGGIHGEPLYLFLNTMVKSFSGNALQVSVIVAFVAVGINLYCYNKFSPFVFSSILIYFSHLYLNKELIQIRSGLGSAFVLYSVIFIKKQKLLPFIVVVLVATFLHSGSIIILPVYWLYRIRFSERMLALPILVGLILSQIHWVFPFLDLLQGMGLLPSTVSGYVGWYEDKLGVFNPITLKQMVICAIAIYHMDFLNSRLPYFYPLLLMYVLSTAWILAFQDFGILAARIATFLSVGDPILLPSLALLFKERKLVLLGILIFPLIILFLNLTKPNFIQPYRSVFFFM